MNSRILMKTFFDKNPYYIVLQWFRLQKDYPITRKNHFITQYYEEKEPNNISNSNGKQRK